MEKEFDISEIVLSAATVPGVKVNRDNFLRSTFKSQKYDEALIRSIIAIGPIDAGISKKEIKKLAKKAIDLETTKVTALSFVAGIPGGFAMIGTIPADLAQFYAHVLRVIQKLLYLYGWDDIDSMNDDTQKVFILFLGAMFGVKGVEAAIAGLCKAVEGKVAKSIAAKALTKTAYYPIIKKICAQLGIKMTKDVFAKSVAKVVPLFGGFVSGGITLATFNPMSNKLLKLLEENS